MKDICLLINGRLKVLRLVDSMTSLACHGIAKDPRVRGLLENQIEELKLEDEASNSCLPVGGFDESPDPVEFRVGKSPTGPFKEILLESAKQAELKMKNSADFLTREIILNLIQDMKEALGKVYPQGIPEYDPVRMELENREDLSDFHSKELTNVSDPQDTKLWFASKELIPEKCLSDFLGKNEKSKVIVKVASKKAGQPSREPVLSEQDQKMLLMHQARRREEIQKMSQEDDDSFMNAPWADQQGLKRRVQGLSNISWKPF